MNKMRYQLNLKIKADPPQQMDGYWRVSLQDFSWTLFADTQDGIVQRVNDAVKLFVDSFAKAPDGVSKLKQYLADHKIDYDLNVQEFTVDLKSAVLFSEGGSVSSAESGIFQAHRTGELALHEAGIA
jgi:hypothetical protein